MRQRRTIYFNDARHYYLFVHEPPMRLQDAWGPVDEVAGTGVDTFVYGMARDDGWFYPSQVARRFGEDMAGTFQQNAYWRVWHNMQSLLDAGHDPLQVLVDRAHERGLDFIASLRMGGYPGLPLEVSVREGGRGMADEGVRDFMLCGVDELATRYDTDGVELDFAAAPGGSGYWFPEAEAEELGPTLTQWMRQASAAVRERAAGPGVIGARVYPTPEANRKTGLEVERWLEEGLVDYVVPMVYGFMIVDGSMPVAWLAEAAHAHDVAVYYMLQPYYTDESRPGVARQYPTPQMFRAAAANAWQAGADGLYTWFMSWPLGARERAVLTELSEPAQIAEGDKHYFLRRRCDLAHVVDVDYPAHLPIVIDPAVDLGRVCELPVTIADDAIGNDHVAAMRLRLGLGDLVSDDRLEVRINGERVPLARTRRWPLNPVSPYSGMWLEIDLRGSERFRKGGNRLEVALLERPEGLLSKVTIEDVEVLVEYDLWPQGRTE